MGERKNWIKLGAVCAAAVLVALGAASAESIEGSVRGSSRGYELGIRSEGLLLEGLERRTA